MLVTKYFTGGQMNENDISRARGTRGEQEKCIHQLDGERDHLENWV